MLVPVQVPQHFIHVQRLKFVTDYRLLANCNGSKLKNILTQFINFSPMNEYAIICTWTVPMNNEKLIKELVVCGTCPLDGAKILNVNDRYSNRCYRCQDKANEAGHGQN